MRRAALLGIVLSCFIAALAHWLHVEATEAAVRVICRPSLKQALVWNGQRIRQEFRLRKAAERQILTGSLLVPAGICLGLLLSRLPAGRRCCAGDAGRWIARLT